MFIACVLSTGVIIGLLDFVLYRQGKTVSDIILKLLNGIVTINLGALMLTQFFFRIPNTFDFKIHGPLYPLKYILLALAVGALYLFIKGVVLGKIAFVKNEKKMKPGIVVAKVFIMLAFVIGAMAFLFTIWGHKTFGELSPDQFLVNLKSPIKGTSSDIVITAFQQPIPASLLVSILFGIFLFVPYNITFQFKDTPKVVFGRIAKVIVTAVVSIAVLVGGVAYGVKVFHLLDVYHAYADSSEYIDENYVDPRDVKMVFPKEKRNLIHIYLESVENSYLSKDLGGYMDQNLMPELTELAKEGVTFSHTDSFLGGPQQTTGSNWSVAGMVNMEMGLPLKIPMDGNSYGTSGQFLPGAVAVGDILASQGYNQTLVLGSDSDFGGITALFETHGNFKLIDYKAAKTMGLIPPDYGVWWGYEDDKLYEFAKDELTRLANEGKPFHLNMETADTHFPDGYMTDNVEKKYPSQYANVIAHSTAQTVEFIRWIQQQNFYKNTTIVLTGDHRSMDTKFFENFDPAYNRTQFNLILNAPVEAKKAVNRQYAPFDIYPTIIASLGIEIDGEHLGMGTNLFSGEKTLVEKDGLEKVNDELSDRSNFYNNYLIAESKDHKFTDKNVIYK